MDGQLSVISKLIIGAICEKEAAFALQTSIGEVKRLMRALDVHNAVTLPIALDLVTMKFEVLDLHDELFRLPFFDDTVEHRRQIAMASINFEISERDLRQAALKHQQPPNGFIFHSGRCGSTLLSNMLAASGSHLVIREPQVINTLAGAWLEARNEVDREHLLNLLAATIQYLLGQAGACGAYEVPYRLLKFAAWNNCIAQELLEWFPETRSVFLYRDPVDTVASQLYQRPAWFELFEQPRQVQLRFFPSLRSWSTAREVTPWVLLAHAWRSSVEFALTIPTDRIRLLEYGALVRAPSQIILDVLSHFGHRIDSKMLNVMEATKKIYSKDPVFIEPFEPSSRHARPDLTCEQSEEVREITYDTLRALQMCT